MNLKDKKIAFGLTDVFYTFSNTILEMKKITENGGKLIPIIQKNEKYADFIKEIQEISNRIIIDSYEEAERIEADILVIAPCSRKCYFKACVFNI